MKRIFLVCLLLSSAFAVAQGGQVRGITLSNREDYSKVMSGATVQLFPCPGIATTTSSCPNYQTVSPVNLYLNQSLTTPVPQITSVASDDNGNYNFWVTPATYNLCISGAQFTTYCQQIDVGFGSASGSGGGAMVYPPAGIPSSLGTSGPWDSPSYGVFGNTRTIQLTDSTGQQGNVPVFDISGNLTNGKQIYGSGQFLPSTNGGLTPGDCLQAGSGNEVADAGQPCGGGGGGGGAVVFNKLASNQSTLSTTPITVASVSLAASSTYFVSIMFRANRDTCGDVYALNYPGGASYTNNWIVYEDPGASGFMHLFAMSNQTGITNPFLTYTGPTTILIEGYVTTIGSGTLSTTFACNVGAGNQSTIFAGSYIYAIPTSVGGGGGGGGGGSVTSVATSGPLTGGPITTTGTVACPTCTVNVASGTITLTGGTAINSGNCSSAFTTAASGLSSSSNIGFSFQGDPTGTTGYLPGAMLSVIPWASTNQVNVKLCNNTGTAAITPATITLRWWVTQ